MAGKDVYIIRTGVANIASMMVAFERLGGAPQLTQDPEQVRTGDWVVLPGVGAFGACMERLEETGIAGAVVDRIEAGRPLLAVCLGLQLLCEGSDENPGVAGLGVVPGRITRFPSPVRTPQFGWNEVEAEPDCRLLESGYAYFANSFRLAEPPDDWHAGLAEHGGQFVAAMERGNLLACQFHPELSGRWGQQLLGRWLRT